jgi:sulfite exporter TauE/SafE
MDCCTHPAGGAPPAALALLFGTGFLMSLGHCAGMCGPIVSAYSLALRSGAAPGSPQRHLLPPLGIYHLGRVLTYAVLGALAGLLGAATGLVGSTRGWEAALAILASAAMLLFGLGLLGILPAWRWVERAPIGARVTRALRGRMNARTWRGQLGLGIANGLLPCGPVAAALLSAGATGRPHTGALAMFAYGAGTIPALVLLGLGAGVLRARLRAGFFRAGAVLVLVVGLQLGLRGLHALGVVGPLRVGPVVFW